MKNSIILILFFLSFTTFLKAQKFDIAVAAKNEFAPSFSYRTTYGMGQSKHFEIGWGLRANGYFSGEKTYLTAPAKLTSGKQSIVAFFTDYNPEKIDTLNLSKSSLVSFNTLIVLQYTFKKSSVGFNIDALGVTFGGKQSGVFDASNSSLDQSVQSAKPTPFNVLLISDSDRGSLNSELYYKYKFSPDKAIRFGLSFQFMEYTTDKVLTYENDRFRHKSLMPFVAYSFNPKKK
ncbi:hypothetical protein EGI22_19955 [Lacihabitans sp. LS3-19]|uniref:hypothetical protein n=1 Tax=Lacihabitans sp. LS3-19 TaxID=2487335 RepID=UPI0020CF92C0|nr:hypothetical protein [Lacihabitans sp. LS3-19]MCP9770185.1 hypothetical protein [Lacihabitans sp. LS3-19]